MVYAHISVLIHLPHPKIIYSPDNYYMGRIVCRYVCVSSNVTGLDNIKLVKSESMVQYQELIKPTHFELGIEKKKFQNIDNMLQGKRGKAN